MSSGADPWSTRDALVPLFCRSIKHLQNRTRPARGPAADEGVRPTTFAGVRLWENYAAFGFPACATEDYLSALLSVAARRAPARSICSRTIGSAIFSYSGVILIVPSAPFGGSLL